MASPGVLDDVARRSPATPIWPMVPRIRSLAPTPKPEGAVEADAHRAWAGAEVRRLGGEDVLDLAGADAERQRAERAVRRGVAVAADDRHARLGDAQLRPDDVDDPWRSEPSEKSGMPNSAQLRSSASTWTRLSWSLMRAATARPVGGDVVVGGRERAVRAAHLAAGQAQAVEGLRAGDLVDEVQVDEQQARGHLVASQILSNSVLGIVVAPPQPAETTARGRSRGRRGSRNGGEGRRRRSRVASQRGWRLRR